MSSRENRLSAVESTMDQISPHMYYHSLVSALIIRGATDSEIETACLMSTNKKSIDRKFLTRMHNKYLYPMLEAMQNNKN